MFHVEHRCFPRIAFLGFSAVQPYSCSYLHGQQKVAGNSTGAQESIPQFMSSSAQAAAIEFVGGCL